MTDQEPNFAPYRELREDDYFIMFFLHKSMRYYSIIIDVNGVRLAIPTLSDEEFKKLDL